MNGTLHIRYVDSIRYKKDYTKRFGIEGIPSNYFINISKKCAANDIRVMWIFDYEWSESSDITLTDGTVIKDYHRKREVLKSYIATATGHIKTRIYARDCELKVFTNKEIRNFLELNCMYGYRSSTLNVGLVLKKDKHGLAKGTLISLCTYGHPFFGKGLYDIEIIRQAGLLGVQCIGGFSKFLKDFLLNYPTLIIGGKEVQCEEICYLVDAAHNDGRSLKTLDFDFVGWEGAGFINMYTDTCITFGRQPSKHKEIMQMMADGKVISIENAGTIVYKIKRSEYIERYSNAD